MSRSVLLIVSLLLSFGKVFAVANDTWGVVLLSVPPVISPAAAGVNTAYYILKQTHEPVLRKDDGSNYSSKILSTWSRSLKFYDYLFCPKTDLIFDARKKFTLEDLLGHLRKITKNFDKEAVISRKLDCVAVKFPVPRSLYLEYLSRYENAPSAPISGKNDENGLGPYFIVEHTADKISLARKKPVSNGYNRIVIYGYSGLAAGEAFKTEINDYNRISPSDVPKTVPANSQSFSNAVLKSFNLIINHPDKDVRDAVYNCVDVDKLRRAYLPGQQEFIDIKSILPLGVSGAEGGRPNQLCKKFKAPKNMKPLLFANWRNDNVAQMKEFSRQFYGMTGVPMVILTVSPEEFSKGVLGAGHPFNLEVLVLDAVSPEYSAFFEYICRRNGLINYLMPKAEALYKRLLAEEEEGRRINIAKEISMEISRESAVLPLFQEIRKFYYPKEIININVGMGFLEYPEVADFRW